MDLQNYDLIAVVQCLKPGLLALIWDLKDDYFAVQEAFVNKIAHPESILFVFV